MTEDQMPYIEKLNGFASSRGFLTATTTYGNKPHNGTLAEAPVLQIRTSSDLSSTAEIGATIQRAIFDNNEETIYEVVP